MRDLDAISNDIIFVSFEQGGGGHKLARVLCALPDIYWYSNPHNGMSPWNVHFNRTDIRQRLISKYHFDRTSEWGFIPPTHDYVKSFIPSVTAYYEMWIKQYNKLDIKLDGRKLIICTHSLPSELLEYFPNCKIINMIGDPTIIAHRYINTSALFPAFLRLDWINGSETTHGKHLRSVGEQLGNDYTVRDLWAYDNHNSLFTNEMIAEYYNTVLIHTTKRMSKRTNFWDINTMNTQDINYNTIKQFIRNNT